MWLTVLLGLLAGLVGGNAFPHFATGITHRPFPTVFGWSPVANLLAGWSGLVLAGVCVALAHPARHPGLVLALVAVGALPIGLFHALGRTVGRGTPDPGR